ncbi:hypothetical protein HYX15_02375 [Candidatus Woesearchaeota archaeon]|nr:hypothetical protein [Candidatus Woesearchaeota archaeon]
MTKRFRDTKCPNCGRRMSMSYKRIREGKISPCPICNEKIDINKVVNELLLKKLEYEPKPLKNKRK